MSMQIKFLTQDANYYPGGLSFSQLNDTEETDRLHCGKEWVDMEGLGWYDNTARFHDAILCRFTTPDPLAEQYPETSPYSHCMGNPICVIDPLGLDTVNITYQDNKWHIDNPIIAEGDDVFIVTQNGETSTYTFSEGEYGNRVNMLNLEIGENKESYTLGVYHVSGTSDEGTGFFVAPGGEPSNKIGSGRRIIDGEYPIIAPHNGAQWRKPGVGGDVIGRGVRFHYGVEKARKHTAGCFILSFDYDIEDNQIMYDENLSLKASQAFDRKLGAIDHFNYKSSNGKIRNGSRFNAKIPHLLILKSR